MELFVAAKGNAHVLELRTERARDNFQSAIDNTALSIQPALASKTVCFCHLTGDVREEIIQLEQEFDRVIRGLMVGPEPCRLADKAKLAQALDTHNVRDVFPPTFLTLSGAINCERGRYPIWFIKDCRGTGGQGIRCVSDAELHTVTMEPNEIIQAGVTNLALLDGRKFTCRIYVFLWAKRVFLFKEGFMLIHKEKYSVNSKSYRVQVDHKGYGRKNSQMDMAPLSSHVNYWRYRTSFAAAITALLPVLDESRQATSDDIYLMLGIDAMLLNGGDVKLIEINTVPNFEHPAEINRAVNIPFFEACLKRMFYQPAESLIEIG